jgi:hypothetical protein
MPMPTSMVVVLDSIAAARLPCATAESIKAAMKE